MKGFTLIEILVVLAVSAVLVGISGGVYTSFNKRSGVDLEARKLESVLNLARNRTLASDGERSFGVHMDNYLDEYMLFPGIAYVASDPENEKFEMPPQIDLSAIQLGGGGSDIIFDRLTGTTSQFGSVVIQNVSDTSNSVTICIASSGAIEIREACAATSLEYMSGTLDGDLASFPSNSGFGDPAQSFRTGADSIYVRQADFYLRKTVASPSDIYLEIRETSTVGNVLGRSWIVDGASLAASFGWTSFIFPVPVLLQENTQYFLRLRSLPDSTGAFFGAEGFIYLGYAHSAFVPPAYEGGDAWRYVGRNNTPSDQGQRLGPADQYDFSFRVIYGINPPPSQDSRHLEFDLLDTSGRGWSIRGATTLRLVFLDPPNADVTRNISMASYFNSGSTEFDWEGSVNVNGDAESLRVHTHYIDANDTTLSIHRDRGVNQKAVDISIDARAIVSYAAGGMPTVGVWGGTMVYR
ncbi:MAG: prepilin-type N-terminal cleavage/methylation domain-containing protein [Candidatus Spechtbacterales bacterium]